MLPNEFADVTKVRRALVRIATLMLKVPRSEALAIFTKQEMEELEACYKVVAPLMPTGRKNLI